MRYIGLYPPSSHSFPPPSLPDEDFSGYIVIDWEEWQPYMNPRSQSVYMQASLQYAGGNIAAAVAQWNASALDWMVQTLLTARELRPHAKIGYYGIVGCYGQWDVEAGRCAEDERARNDALAPLWAASSALYPSIYSDCRYAGTPYPRCLPDAAQGNITQAQKIPITLAEAVRVNAHRVPVLAFTWYTLYNRACAVPPPVGLGHCPLMRHVEDLAAEFALAKTVGIDGINIDGIVVWGSSGDVRRGTTDCQVFASYLSDTLGPVLHDLTQPDGTEPGWNPVNRDCVSGKHLRDPGVWVAGHTDSYAACQALCASNATCNSCDWAGDADINGGKCNVKRTCYFRADAFYSPHENGKCNHTSGHKPGAPGPAPEPPAPSPSPAMCGGKPGVPCHSDADCDTGAAPPGCSWCRSPHPGKGNKQTCSGPPAPGDCGVLPGPALNASATQYACFGDSVSKGIFGRLEGMLSAPPFEWEAFHPAHTDGGGCGNTVRGRDCTDFWLEGQNRSLGRTWDVITFNYGLHDLANDSEFVSLDVYASNLRNITTRLLSAPGLKRLFWLSSTPVPGIALSPPRAQADVPKYNAAALSVMREQAFKDRVRVVDVYSFVLAKCGGDPHYKSCAPFQHATDVHFSKEGYTAMAQFIVDAITKR